MLHELLRGEPDVVGKFRVLMAKDFVAPESDVETEVLEPVATLESVRLKDEEELKTHSLGDADGLLVWHSVKITSRTIDSLTKCRGIVSCAVGFNNIDVKSASEHGILVCNVPDYCIDEVSDHAIGLMIALNRRIIQHDRLVREGGWDFDSGSAVMRFRGKVLGILGLGRIGTATALKAQALGFRVIEYDPYIPAGKEKSLNVQAVDFETLLRESDVLSLHVPLTDETHHMINEASLRKMKKRALLINTCRGRVVDAQALAKALKGGWIAAAGLDVQEVEPLPKDQNPFLEMDNVILTPHQAFYSEESVVEMRKKAAEELIRIFHAEKPRSPVNPHMLKAP